MISGLAEAAPAACTQMGNGPAYAGVTMPAQIAHASTQLEWAALSVDQRLLVLRSARHRIAAEAERFVAAISSSLPRNGADTLTAELMPMLDACKFVEKNAANVLRPKKLGSRGRPFWLSGVVAEVHREPLGTVLVIGPANFPLFLPGVQVLQALAAGNSVVWKPAPGGRGVAELVKLALEEAGLPGGLLRVTDESIEAAQTALADQPAKVVFTGSHEIGCAVLAELAKTATPAVMELSGADAVVVMPGADLVRTARAVAFGLRLNGGQVCMSPRRLFAERETMAKLLPLLTRELEAIPAVPLNGRTASLLQELVAEARVAGAELLGDVDAAAQRPLLVQGAQPDMRIASTDVFAPVLSLLELPSLAELPEAYAACPYGLTAAIFCGRAEEAQAQTLGLQLQAGTVLINDLIAPTADPRVPFGGRGASGFGVTRGAEGLLEMTAPKVLLMRRSGTMRHLEPASEADAPLLANVIRVAHAGTWRERWNAVRQVAALGRKRGVKTKAETNKEKA